MFFRHGSVRVPSSLVVLYFKSSQIYLFDRILATSCFSAKTDKCFNSTEFMFHNQTNDNIQPLPFAKNYNISKHCTGRKVVHFLYTFQSAKVFD